MRWVVKVGSAVISNADGRLDRKAIARIGTQLAGLYKKGHEVILVTSGAIAAGVGRLRWKERPTSLGLKQSAAAVGQLALMEAYEDVFSKAGIVPAQVLLTRFDLQHKEQFLNIRKTILNLLHLKTIPIINENDTVSTEEIQFGDNDMLSAILATKVHADKLILLSNVDGFYDVMPKGRKPGKIVEEVKRITRKMEKKASKKSGSRHSTGGIYAKLVAAKKATAAGIETWIASGNRKNTLNQILKREKNAGTHFFAKNPSPRRRPGSRPRW